MNNLEKNKEQGSNTAGNMYSSAVSKVKDQAEDIIHQTKDSASDLAERATEYGEKAMESTRGVIRRYPGQAILAGVALGFIGGMFLARR